MSEFIPVEDFLRAVRPTTPEVVEPTLVLYILESIRELCQRAPVWQYDHPAIDMVTGVTEYKLDPPLINSKIHSIISVHIDGRWIGTLDNQARTPQSASALGGTVRRPSCYENLSRGTLMLCGTPSEDLDDGIVVRASVKPELNSDEVLASLFADYYDVIAAGVKSRALNVLGRAWYDPVAAREFKAAFLHGCREARMSTDRGMAFRDVKVRARRFA